MQELFEKLKDSKSSKRRSAAKKLRKLGNPEAGPYLFEALKNELKDSRTWEAQYQMIMAIGECEYSAALPFLAELIKQKFEATMIYVAAGDAIVRLSRENENDALPAIMLFKTGNQALIEGGLQAVAMLRMCPPGDQISRIIDFASNYGMDEYMRFYVAVAASGWEGPEVEAFLKQCMDSTQEHFKSAVEHALNNKYKKWEPL